MAHPPVLLTAITTTWGPKNYAELHLYIAHSLCPCGTLEYALTQSSPTGKMKSILALPFLLPLATSSPYSVRRATYGPPTSEHFDEVLAGSRKCASSAVVIGRETWAPGNIGVLWGARFRDELVDAFNGDVDVQGINDYPARLVDYHIGGSDTGADSCARMVEKYAAACPASRIFLSGYRYVEVSPPLCSLRRHACGTCFEVYLLTRV